MINFVNVGNIDEFLIFKHQLIRTYQTPLCLKLTLPLAQSSGRY